MLNMIVISNCMSLGYTKSIQLMRPNDTVSLITMAQSLSEAGTDLAPYDIVFTSVAHKASLEKRDPLIFEGKQVCLLPLILFFGFHPDITYITHNGKLLKLLNQDYHSALAWSGFQLDLSVDETLALYHPSVFKQLGAFDIYQREKQALIQTFTTHGLNLAKHFAKWSRTGCFMHSVNHPRIDVIYDIAQECLRVNGLDAYVPPAYASGPPCADNLANGSIMPVLPPIAERFGLPGNTTYKMANDRALSQRDFIIASHALYASLEPGSMKQGPNRLSFEQLKNHISLPERSSAS